MNSLSISLIALAILFFTSQIFGYVIKIRDDRFYRPYHFLGGLFIFLLMQSLFRSYILSFILVFVVGVVWEIHEWTLWKYFLKKKIYKPGRKDTIDDMIMDMSGATLMFVILEFFKVSI